METLLERETDKEGGDCSVQCVSLHELTFMSAACLISHDVYVQVQLSISDYTNDYAPFKNRNNQNFVR